MSFCLHSQQCLSCFQFLYAATRFQMAETFLQEYVSRNLPSTIGHSRTSDRRCSRKKGLRSWFAYLRKRLVKGFLPSMPSSTAGSLTRGSYSISWVLNSMQLPWSSGVLSAITNLRESAWRSSRFCSLQEAPRPFQIPAVRPRENPREARRRQRRNSGGQNCLCA